jgi:hypothetical protein
VEIDGMSEDIAGEASGVGELLAAIVPAGNPKPSSIANAIRHWLEVFNKPGLPINILTLSSPAIPKREAGLD